MDLDFNLDDLDLGPLEIDELEFNPDELDFDLDEDILWEVTLLNSKHRQLFIHYMDYDGHVHPIVRAMLDDLTKDTALHGGRYPKRFYEFLEKHGHIPQPHQSAVIKSLAELNSGRRQIRSALHYPSVVWQCGEHIYVLISRHAGAHVSNQGEVLFHYLASEDPYAESTPKRTSVLQTTQGDFRFNATVKLMAHDQYGYVLAYTNRIAAFHARDVLGYAYYAAGQLPSNLMKRNITVLSQPHPLSPVYGDPSGYYKEHGASLYPIVLIPRALVMGKRIWARSATGKLHPHHQEWKSADGKRHGVAQAMNHHAFMLSNGNVLEMGENAEITVTPALGERKERIFKDVPLKPSMLPIIHAQANQHQARLPFRYEQPQEKASGTEREGKLYRTPLYVHGDLLYACLVCGALPVMREVTTGNVFCTEECHAEWHAK